MYPSDRKHILVMRMTFKTKYVTNRVFKAWKKNEIIVFEPNKI